MLDWDFSVSENTVSSETTVFKRREEARQQTRVEIKMDAHNGWWLVNYWRLTVKLEAQPRMGKCDCSNGVSDCRKKKHDKKKRMEKEHQKRVGSTM